MQQVLIQLIQDGESDTSTEHTWPDLLGRYGAMPAPASTTAPTNEANHPIRGPRIAHPLGFVIQGGWLADTNIIPAVPRDPGDPAIPRGTKDPRTTAGPSRPAREFARGKRKTRPSCHPRCPIHAPATRPPKARSMSASAVPPRSALLVAKEQATAPTARTARTEIARASSRVSGVESLWSSGRVGATSR